MPRPKLVPHVEVAFGVERSDPLAWLEDRTNPAVVAYLAEENAYADTFFKPRAAATEAIFEEIRSHIVEDDLSVPLRHVDHWYYARTATGAAYATHLRCPATGLEPPLGLGPHAGEQPVLDENALAEGHPFFAVGGFELSPNGRLLAYSTDRTGDERYELRIRDLETGLDLSDLVVDVTYGLAWSADSSTIFYLTTDEAQRPDRAWRHRLGEPQAQDQLVLHEQDRQFSLGLFASRDGQAVIIEAASSATTECWWVPTGDPTAAARPTLGRRHGVEYAIDHRQPPTGEGHLVVLTNDDALDFRVLRTEGDLELGALTELVAHRPGERIAELLVTAKHLVTTRRVDANLVASVQRFGADGLLEGAGYELEGPTPGLVHVAETPLAHGERLRLVTQGLAEPRSLFDLELDGGHRSLLKRTEVPGGFDPEAYEASRIEVVARDGAVVPVSLVRRRDLPAGPAPLLLYGYGAYEHSIDPSFSPARLPLLDRGVAFAIAHVRGGGEKGRAWYDDGHLEAKQNTFNDVVDVARHLVASGLTSPDRLALRGRSAGGLLVGATLNQDPELFCAAVAEVPFVDVVTTMRNEELPLTTGEWEEWGDPLHDEEAFHRMLSYSPVDQVSATGGDGQPRRYPRVLATGGLHDARVAYWEPAKWINALRAVPGGPYYLRTELEAGHGGPSGRYDAWREEASTLTFILDALGVELSLR